MTHKKLLLTLATVSILFTGCNEKETSSTPTEDTVVTEKVIKTVEKPLSNTVEKTIIKEIK